MEEISELRRYYEDRKHLVKSAEQTIERESVAVTAEAMGQYALVASVQGAQAAGELKLSDVDNCELLVRSVFARNKVDEQIKRNITLSDVGNTEEKLPSEPKFVPEEFGEYTEKQMIDCLPATERKNYNEHIKKSIRIPFFLLSWLCVFALYVLGVIALEGALGAALMREHADNVFSYAFSWEVTGIDAPVIIAAGFVFQLCVIYDAGKEGDPGRATIIGAILAAVICVIGGGAAFVIGTNMPDDGLLAFAPIIVFVVAAVVNLGLMFVLMWIVDIIDVEASQREFKSKQHAWEMFHGAEYVEEVNRAKQQEYEEAQKECHGLYENCSALEYELCRTELWRRASLSSFYNAFVALIDNNTFLPASFKDDFSIAFIYRELKEGLSDTLKEAKQRCEAKKDMESFKSDMLGLIDKGFSMLGDNLSKQLKRIGYDIEARQSAAFRELSSAQEKYQREQIEVAKKMSDDQSEYYRSEKEANEQTRKAVERALKKLTN